MATDKLDNALAPYEKSALQIVDANFNPIHKLEIANLYDGKKLLTPSQSKDRFYIQYQNKALAGKGNIKVNLKGYHLTDPTALSASGAFLYEKPSGSGNFISDALVLVSDRRICDIIDEAFPSDLNKKITVTYQNEVSNKTETVSAFTPAKKLLEVEAVVYQNNDDTSPVDSYSIAWDQELRQRILAPTGIQIINRPTQTLKTLPAGVDFKDGLNKDEQILLAKHIAQTLPPFEGIRTVYLPGEHKILVSSKDSEKNIGGIALIQRSKQKIESHHNTVLVNSKLSENGRVSSHEIVHCLIASVLGSNNKRGYRSIGHDSKDPMHHPDHLNLMYPSSTPFVGELINPENLSEEQIEVILQSPLLKNPTPRIDLQKSHPTPVLAPAL